ncbi:glutamate receptor ionotropic, delta-2 isoform X1 [Ostrinia furnacalis]|uniref:glutamate receptor ionotropic, delta-2 isoform X1 n=2 Tax=Ostrinia furnacalis TaxID=93504 RepID=UPI001038F256|nr:glutamate receptor ionotropic, delta-2 isoform X1 [Ostrinia furnacalis]
MATGIELIISTICNATFCEPVYDNPVLESHTSSNLHQYRDLIKELNGKHLKIGTYNNRPFSWVERGENGTLIGNGVSFVLVDILQKRFNFTYEVVVPQKNFEMGGAKPEDSLIGLVNNGQVDMAAAFLPKLTRFHEKVSFSYDLDEGIWVMMLKRPKESAAGSGLLAPFNSAVWYLILVAVLSYGPCITLLTKLRSRLVPDGEKYILMSPSFWFVYGAFIKQGTNLAPDANTTRVLFTTWWIFIILLSAFYTANLTAFLTLSKFTLDIENPQDLYKKNYRWVSAEGGAVQYVVSSPNEVLYYLSRMISTGRAEFRSMTSLYDYLPLVNGGAVLVEERVGIDELMYGDYLRKAREGVAETDRCTYVIAPNFFMKKLRGFAYPKNSKLTGVFDSVLSYVLQAGIVDFLEHRDLPSTKICPLDLQSKDRQLLNSDLLMTYMIMFTGLAAAIAVFIGEVIVKRYIIKDSKSNKLKRKKTKFQKNPRFYNYDDSRPPPYDSIFGRSPKIKVNAATKTKIINGREYLVIDAANGDTRLIPVRTPSAFLYRLDR